MAEIWLTEREVEKRRQKLDYLKGERRLELLAKGGHGMVELRKHLPLYFTGRRGASALKKALSQVKTMEELERLLLDRDGCGQYNSMN